MFHGRGLYCSKINGTNEGEWKEGKLNGFAITKESNGNKYEGMYQNDLKHGKGIDTYANG